MNGHCLTTSAVYKATTTQYQNNQQKTYIGLTENTFQTRYNLHPSSLRNRDNRKSTTWWTSTESETDHLYIILLSGTLKNSSFNFSHEEKSVTGTLGGTIRCIKNKK